jgi:hypothetical protein
MSLSFVPNFALTSTLVVVGGAYFVYRALTRKHVPSHLPPGPPPLPFVGNLHQMPTSNQIEGFRDMAKIYGASRACTSMQTASQLTSTLLQATSSTSEYSDSQWSSSTACKLPATFSTNGAPFTRIVPASSSSPNCERTFNPPYAPWVVRMLTGVDW